MNIHLKNILLREGHRILILLHQSFKKLNYSELVIGKTKSGAPGSFNKETRVITLSESFLDSTFSTSFMKRYHWFITILCHEAGHSSDIYLVKVKNKKVDTQSAERASIEAFATFCAQKMIKHLQSLHPSPFLFQLNYEEMLDISIKSSLSEARKKNNKHLNGIILVLLLHIVCFLL